MRASFLAGAASAALIALTPALALADCSGQLASLGDRLDAADASDGPKLTAGERNDVESLRRSAETFQKSGDMETCERIARRADITFSAALDPQVIDAESLEDRDVVGVTGDELGEVEEVRMDPKTGKIAYLMVEYGGFIGLGDELAAIPWELVRATNDEQGVVVDVTEEQLKGSPRWSEKIGEDVSNREWANSVHSYYGVRPYWRSSRSGGEAAPNTGKIADGGTDGEIASSDQGVSPSKTPSSGAAAPAASSDGTAPRSDASDSASGQGQAGQNDGATKIVAGIDRLVEEISELRAVLTKSLERQEASAANAKPVATDGGAASPGAKDGAEQDASGNGAANAEPKINTKSDKKPMGGQAEGADDAAQPENSGPKDEGKASKSENDKGGASSSGKD